MILKYTQNCLYRTLITKKRKAIILCKYELHTAYVSMTTYILNQFSLGKSKNLRPGGGGDLGGRQRHFLPLRLGYYFESHDQGRAWIILDPWSGGPVFFTTLIRGGLDPFDSSSEGARLKF